MINQVDKCYKFRMYPNKIQQKWIEQIFGCTRFVYNYFLAKSEQDYKQGKKFSSTYDNQKELTAMKKYPEFEFLKQSDSQALNQALANLGLAYSRFFKKLSDRPKFKKKNHDQSYTTFVTANPTTLSIKSKRIYIPKIGWVKLKQHQDINGRVTSGTISKTASGKYFISLHYQRSEISCLEKTNSEIGFDLGIESLLIDQNGNKIKNPRHIKKTLDKIKLEQQRIQTKKKGSNNYNKQRIKLAKLYEKVANQRKDFLHKLSHSIVKNHDFIAAEDLDVKSMLESDFSQMPKWQQKVFHRNISDVSWSEFLRQLDYKANWYGRIFIQVNQFFPSSQLCSCCGYKNPLVKDLSVRKWTCPNCGTSHDRDHNAAKNILAEAHRLAIT